MNKNLENIIKDAVANIFSDYDEIVDEVINSEDEFSDDGFVGQDIVDTGRLRDSKMIDAKDLEATWTWDPTNPETGEKYAAKVWSGFFAYDGNKWVPGRHWAERAAKNLDPANALVEYLQKEGLDAEIVKNNIDDIND